MIEPETYVIPGTTQIATAWQQHLIETVPNHVCQYYKHMHLVHVTATEVIVDPAEYYIEQQHQFKQIIEPGFRFNR